MSGEKVGIAIHSEFFFALSRACWHFRTVATYPTVFSVEIDWKEIRQMRAIYLKLKCFTHNPSQNLSHIVCIVSGSSTI